MVTQRPSHRPHRARVMFLSGILVFELAPVGRSQDAATASDPTADTVEILNLLINERLASGDEAPEGEYLVVAAETIVLCPPVTNETEESVSLFSMLSDPSVLPDVPESMRRELLCEPEGGMLPSARLENAQVVLASEVDAIFSGNGWWEDFYRTYPGSGGYARFTKPVFSSDRKHALIYMSDSCGGLCGTGWLVYLSHDGTSWQIAAHQMLWIS